MADYVKLPEVARRLDVSEKTARRMVKAGKLPAMFIGGAYRVSEEDLAAFLETSRVDPGKAQRRSSLQPSLLNGGEEERRADVKGPDESVWGAPQNRPGPSEQIPESAGQHIHVEIRDDLSNEQARVTIARTAFLDMLRRHGLAKTAAEEVIEELRRISA